MFFRKSYLVEVCFAGGNRPFIYLWQGNNLQPGDIVIVPTGNGTKCARVAGVSTIDRSISKCRVRRILRLADKAECAVFSCADQLRPDERNSEGFRHKNIVIGP